MDLSKVEGTITNRVEPLIFKMKDMEYAEIKAYFLKILRDYDTVQASEVTREKWLLVLRSKKTKEDLVKTLNKLYLAGCWYNSKKRPTKKQALLKLQSLKEEYGEDDEVLVYENPTA